MESSNNSLRGFLSAKGFKNTKEREILLAELETHRNHFNAEDLYACLSRKGPRVSKPTIYRTLKLLEKLHLIKRFDIKKNCFYYEPLFHKGDHGHLICDKCGKIIDFSIGDLSTLRSAILKKRRFTPDYISIRIFGRCKRCQEA
jgi:Fur family ferric uptake transcriptional regulator